MKYIFFLVLIFAPTFILSQEWQKIASLENGAIVTITINDNGYIFAGTQTNGMFLSTDSGITWIKKNNGLLDTNILSSVSNGTGDIFVGTLAEGIHRSTNNGDNWEQINNGLTNPYYISSLFAHSSLDIYAGTIDGIYKTTNNGDNWLSISPNLNLPVFIKSILVNNDNYIYATEQDSGIYRSVDNGASWSIVNNFGNKLNIDSDNNLYASTYSGIIKSTNNGDDWFYINNGLSSYISNIVINSLDYIYTSSGGVYFSPDKGENWFEFNIGLENQSVYSMAIDSEGFVYAGLEDGSIFKTTESTEKPINILFPKGNEILDGNVYAEIEWASYGIETINIEYSLEADNWNPVATNISANTGSYPWLVPNTPSQTCRIKITDMNNTDNFDISDQFFTIKEPSTETEVEPNNTREQANQIAYGDSLRGAIYPIDDNDYFTFNASSIDTIQIKLNTLTSFSLTLYIYGDVIYFNNNEPGSAIVILGSGTYFLNLYSSSSSGSYPKSNISGSIILNDDFRKMSNTFQENNIYNKDRILLKNDPNEKLGLNVNEYILSIKKYSQAKPTFLSKSFTGEGVFDVHSNFARIGTYFLPNGSQTEISWEYGTNTNYDYTKTFSQTFDGFDSYYAGTVLENLTPNTTYYYRIRLANLKGETISEDYMFTTPEIMDKGLRRVDLNLINYVDTSFIATAEGGWYYTLPRYTPIDMSFANQQKGWLKLRDLSGFLITDTGGEYWENQDYNSDVGYFVRNIDFIDESNGFLSSLNSFTLETFRTMDGGYNFEKTSDIDLKYLSGGLNSSLTFIDANRGFLIGIGGITNDVGQLILTTSNGGIKWEQPILYFTNEKHNRYNDISFANSSTGTIVGNNFGDGILLQSSDSGNSWSKSEVDLDYKSLRGISYGDSHFGMIIGYDYQENENLILRTKDGGQSWSNISNFTLASEQYYTNISILDSLYGIIIGTQGLILKTTNGGDEWAKIESGTLNDLYYVELFENHDFVIVGDWGTILKGNLITTVDESQNELPVNYQLLQNYPNPFNPVTSISFSLPRTELVTIKIYDILGREVVVLVDEVKTAGNYTVNLNGTQLASGVYFYRMETEYFNSTKKLLLLK